jgi:hypothetical protein
VYVREGRLGMASVPERFPSSFGKAAGLKGGRKFLILLAYLDEFEPPTS